MKYNETLLIKRVGILKASKKALEKCTTTIARNYLQQLIKQLELDPPVKENLNNVIHVNFKRS